MKRILAAVILIVFLTSAITVAQDYRLYPPPMKPFYQKTMTPQELWVYDTTVKLTDKGYVFSAKVKALFYAGLDEKGERIAYNYKKDADQDDPADFELIEEVFSGDAYLKVGHDPQTVASTRFKVTGGLGDKKKAGEQDGIIEFAPISTNLKLLPTMYKIVVELSVGSQKFKQYLWIDKEERKKVNGVEHVLMVRDDPRTVSRISADAFLLVREKENGRLETFKEGAVHFYESALRDAKKVGDLEKRLKDTRDKMVKEQNPGIRINLDITYHVLLGRLQKYKFWANDSINKILKVRLEESKQLEMDFKQAVHTFDRTTKIAIVGVLEKIQGFYTEVYYTSYGCSPYYKAKNAEKMKKHTRKYKISQYLTKGTPGVDVESGTWKSDKWLDNLENNWMKKIQEIKNDFRKIFGKAMLDPKANESEPGYFGIDAEGNRTFWEPTFKTGYETLYDYLFTKDLLTKTVQALANQLTDIHSNAKVKRYPFVKEDTGTAYPNPSSASSFAGQVAQIKKNICKRIYTCTIPPEKLVDPNDKKNDNDKRKTEWVCPNCGTKSGFRPPSGKCPVCGTPMEEKPITNDNEGMTEGGR